MRRRKLCSPPALAHRLLLLPLLPVMMMPPPPRLPPLSLLSPLCLPAVWARSKARDQRVATSRCRLREGLRAAAARGTHPLSTALSRSLRPTSSSALFFPFCSFVCVHGECTRRVPWAWLHCASTNRRERRPAAAASLAHCTASHCTALHGGTVTHARQTRWTTPTRLTQTTRRGEARRGEAAASRREQANTRLPRHKHAQAQRSWRVERDHPHNSSRTVQGDMRRCGRMKITQLSNAAEEAARRSSLN